MPHDCILTIALIVVVWASCSFVHPTVRQALIAGLRCLGRFPDLWRIPALFGFGYAIFQLIAAALFHWRMKELREWILDFSWQPLSEWQPLLLSGISCAAEHTVSIFTIFSATFPLSALFALLLLFNFRGLLVEMTRAFRRRLGHWRGLCIALLLFLTALCAVTRPAAYLLLPEAFERMPIAAILTVSFLSFIFEMLLGIFFLTYLMLMAYAWLRGLHFQRDKLLHVAMRRTGFVLKWSLPLATLAAMLILLPLYLPILVSPGSDLENIGTWFSTWIGLPIITAIAFVHLPVQAILVFHNESLRDALRESRRLMRSQWPPILLFLLATYALFLLLALGSNALTMQLGFESSAALVALIFTAWIEAMLAGWLIASWVCLYKSLSAGRKEIPF